MSDNNTEINNDNQTQDNKPIVSENPMEKYKTIISEHNARLDRIINSSKTSEKWTIFAELLAVSLLSANILFHSGISGVLIPVSIPLLYIEFYCWVGFNKEYFNSSSITMLVMIFLLCGGFVINNDSLTNIVTLLTLAVAIPLQLRLSTQGDTLFDFSIIKRSLNTVFSDTFSVLPITARTMATDKKKGNKSKTIIYVLAGVLCTIPFFIILSALFASGDDMFRASLRQFANMFDDVDALSPCFTIIVGVTLTVYFTALFIRLRAKVEQPVTTKTNSRKFNTVAVATFLVILIALELFFSAIQVKYLFLNNATLAEGESFADYARHGFAEISAATIITIIIICVVSAVTQKNEKSYLPVSIRILLSLFSLCVCMTFSSAYYRMMMYIEAYSLTVKRVAVCWLMAVMLLILIGIVLSFWIKNFKLMKFVTYSVMISVIALNLLCVQSFVAKNNVDRYLENADGYALDISYLAKLQPGSTAQLERLYNTSSIKNTGVYDSASYYLFCSYKTAMNYSWADSNIPTCKSKKIISHLFENNSFDYREPQTSIYTDENDNQYYYGNAVNDEQTNKQSYDENDYSSIHEAYDSLPTE